MADVEKTPQQIGAEIAQAAGLWELAEAGIEAVALLAQDTQDFSHQGSGGFRRTRAINPDKALDNRCADIAAQMQRGGKSPQEIAEVIMAVQQKASSR